MKKIGLFDREVEHLVAESDELLERSRELCVLCEQASKRLRNVVERSHQLRRYYVEVEKKVLRIQP